LSFQPGTVALPSGLKLFRHAGKAVKTRLNAVV